MDEDAVLASVDDSEAPLDPEVEAKETEAEAAAAAEKAAERDKRR